MLCPTPDNAPALHRLCNGYTHAALRDSLAQLDESLECSRNGFSGKKRSRPAEYSPVIGVLKVAIRACGLSLPEQSRRAEVSNPQIYRFMSSERSLTLPADEKLATVLGLRLAKDTRT
jgi:hypothetical protein